MTLWPTDRPLTPHEQARLESYVFARREAEDGERHAPTWAAIAALARQNGVTRPLVDALP